MSEYEIGWVIFIGICVVLTFVTGTLDLIDHYKEEKRLSEMVNKERESRKRQYK